MPQLIKEQALRPISKIYLFTLRYDFERTVELSLLLQFKHLFPMLQFFLLCLFLWHLLVSPEPQLIDSFEHYELVQGPAAFVHQARDVIGSMPIVHTVRNEVSLEFGNVHICRIFYFLFILFLGNILHYFCFPKILNQIVLSRQNAPVPHILPNLRGDFFKEAGCVLFIIGLVFSEGHKLNHISYSGVAPPVFDELFFFDDQFSIALFVLNPFFLGILAI